jgi:hypothetical protein
MHPEGDLRMHSIPLTEFVASVGQIKAAAALRMSQGGISKALKAAREVYVTELADGSYSAHELKPFPSQKSVA